MNSDDDRLGEQLRREAMAERPAHSRELHQRIMRGVRARRTVLNWRWPTLAAAAAIVIASGAVWLSQKNLETQKPPVGQIATTQIQPRPLKLRPDLAVDIGGVVSARAWPPAIGLWVPGVRAKESSPPPKEAVPPAPSDQTQQALAGVLPTEVRALIFMSVNATE